MKTLTKYFALCVLLFSLSVNSAEKTAAKKRELSPEIPERLAQLPATTIDYDRNLLNENEKKVLAKLIEAAGYIHEIFLRQVAEETPAVQAELKGLAETSEDYVRALKFFNVMVGRWDRLEHMEPLIGPFGEEGKRPPGGGFYPIDMTRDEFEKWVAAHPEDKEKFQHTLTVIRRKNEKLVAIPYSEFYRDFLQPAADKLKEAAAISENATLRDYLNKRAAAFLSNDYYESDVAWMDLNSPLEVVIGPYEVYEDELFNYKASFECFLTVVDKAESEKLAIYAADLPDMEKKLPIPDEHKNPNRGAESPIRVVQEAFTSGDARSGVMTAAFNLPNDEKVREAKGSKKVLLKNVMQAKFAKTGEPIAMRVLDASQTKGLSFDAYFNHTLFHELSHGLGPGIITGRDGKKIEARLLLKNLYSTIEEAKADVLGVWNLLYAIDNNLLKSFDKNTLYITYTGLIFRLMRHGIEEAHGKANAIQWNYLREKGAIVPSAEGRFKVIPEKMFEATKTLSNELLMIEATGDFERAKKFIDQYGKSNAEIEAINSRLKDLPRDISPIFTAAGEKE